MRISDWSSDVCSSDLLTLYVDDGTVEIDNNAAEQVLRGWRWGAEASSLRVLRLTVQTTIQRSNKAGAGRLPTGRPGMPGFAPGCLDRKSGGEGKSVAVRVDLGGRRLIKKKKKR